MSKENLLMLNSECFPNYYSQSSASDNLPSLETSSLKYNKSDLIKNQIFTDNDKNITQDNIINSGK